MKANSFYKFFVSLFISILFACEEETVLQLEEATVAEIVEEQEAAAVLDHVAEAAIPEIIDEISARTLDDEASKSSGKISYRKVDIDLTNIMRVRKDGVTNYTFALDVKEASVYHIYNLVVGVDSRGNGIEPYIIGYEMEPDDMDAFFESGEDFSKFKTNYRYYTFSSFFADSKLGKNGDCGGGATGGGHNGNNETRPGSTFTIGQGRQTVSSTFSNTRVSIPYGYSITITSNGRPQTRATTASSSGVNLTTPQVPRAPVLGVRVPVGTTNVNVSASPSGNGGGGLCFKVTGTGDSVLFTRTDCSGDKVKKSAGKSGKGDCPGGNGTVGINTAAKSVQKLAHYLGNSYVKKHLDFLSKNLSFSSEMVEYTKNNGLSSQAKIATKMTIDAMKQGKLAGRFDSQYFKTINPYFSRSTIDPATMAYLTAHYAAQCAILKTQNPTWSDAKIYWEVSREIVQLLLDLGGLVPVVGEVCDVANGIIYAVNGDGVNASLSFAAAIPVAGWFATGSKLAYKTASNLGSKQVLKWLVKTNGKIDFGSRGQLKKVMGSLVKNGEHAHHIIPWAKSDNKLVQLASKAGDAFHMNDLVNGLSVAAWRNTNHPAYSVKVEALMQRILKENPNMTPNEAVVKLKEAIEYIKETIKNNPNKKLQNLSF